MRTPKKLSLLLAAATLTATAAYGATAYWDTNGATAGSGNANGTWDAATASWTTDATGATATAVWAAGDTAVFSAGTDFIGTHAITVAGTQVLSGLTVSAPASGTTLLTISGGTLDFGAVAGTISTSGLGTGTTTNGHQVLISSTLTGTAGLTISANGNTGSATGGNSGAYLQLGGDNSGLSGGITITSGLVDFLAPAAFGSNAITLAGGGLLNANHGALTLTNAVTLGAGGGTIRTYGGVGTTIVLDGLVSGSGALTKTDGGTAGTLVLSGNNTYSGGTNLGNGVVRYSNTGSGNALGTGAITFTGAAILGNGLDSSAVAKTIANNIVINSAIVGTVDTFADLTVTGTVTGAGALTKTGTAALILAGNATYTGATVVGAGTLQFAQTGTSVLGGVISGAGSLVQSGSGTTILSGNNTLTGTTTVSAGILELAGSGALTSSAISVGGGTLQIDATGKTLSSLTMTGGALSLAAKTGSTTTVTGAFNITSGSVTVNPVLAGLTTTGTVFDLITAGSITNSGTLVGGAIANSRVAGTVAVSGNKLQYTVTTGAADLQWTNSAANGIWDLNTTSNFTNAGVADKFLNFDGVNFNDNVSPASRTVTVAGTVLPGQIVVNNSAAGGAYTFSGTGVISGSGSLVKSGDGTLVLGSGLTYAAGGAVTVNAGTLDLGGVSRSAGSLLLASGSVTNGTLSATSVELQSGTVSSVLNISGPVSKTTTGVVTLTGTHTITGTTTLGASTGTLVVGNNTTTGTLGSGAVVNNGTLVLARSDATSTSSTVQANAFANNFSGTGTIIIGGTGTVTFTNLAGSFAGNILVNSGTFRYDVQSLASGSTGSLSSGAVVTTVNAGAIFSSAASEGSGYSAARLINLGSKVILNGGTWATGGSTGAWFNRVLAATTIQVDADSTINASKGSFGQVTRVEGVVTGAGNLSITRDATAGSAGARVLTFAGSMAAYSGNITVQTTTNVTSPVIFGNAAGWGSGNLYLVGANSVARVGDELASTVNSAFGGTLGYTAGTVTPAGLITVGSTAALQVNNLTAAYAILLETRGGVFASGGTLSANGTLGTSAFVPYTNTNWTFGGAALNTVSGNVQMTYAGTKFIVYDSVAGAGVDTVVSGNISGANQITKAGPGTMTVSGVITATGGFKVNGGVLNLDYSTNNNTKLGTGALSLIGGSVSVANGSVAETVGGLTIAGGTAINRVSGTGTIALGAITRNAGATLDLSAAGFATTTNVNNAAGVLGSWATVNGTDLAAVTGNAVVAYTGYADTSRLESGAKVIAGTVNTNARIVEGTGSAPANLTVAAGTTTINALVNQSTGGVATVDLTGGVLRVGAVGTVLNATAAGALTIQNGTLTAGGADDTAGELILNNSSSANALTVSSVVADNGTGAVTVVKSGAGRVVLSGVNTFTGGVSLGAGILAVSADTALGAVPGASTAGKLVFNGGTLQAGASFAIAANRGITLNEGGGVIDTSTFNINYDGVIAGTGTLIKAGAGELILTGASTYTGGTALLGGTLRVGTNDSALGTGAISVIGSGRIASNNSGGARTLTNAIFIAPGQTLTTDTGYVSMTFAGTLTGTGTLLAGSGNTLTLSGNNSSYMGALNVGGSTTLAISGTSNAASVSVGGNAATLSVVSGGRLTVAGTTSFGSNPTTGLNVATGGTLNTNALNGSWTTNWTIDGIVNTGSTTVSTNSVDILAGAGTLNTGSVTFSNYSIINYSGLTLNDAGVFYLGTSGQGGTFNQASGTVNLNTLVGNSFIIGNATLQAGLYALSGGVLNAAGTDLVLSNSTGTGTLNISGGAANLRGIKMATNTGAANLAVTGGTLKVGAGGIYSGGGTGLSTINLGTATIGSLAGWSSTLAMALTDGVSPSTTTTFDTTGGNISLGGVLSGSGSIKVAGTNVLTLGGVNTYAGTTTIGSANGVDGGTLRLAGAGTLGTGALTVYGGTFSLGGTTQTLASLNLGGGASGSTAIVGFGGGTLNLGGDIVYDATNNPNGAVVSTTGTGAMNLNGARQAVVGDSTAAASDLTINTVIADGTGVGSLTKQGAGTLTLAGKNTYTGATSLQNGILVLDGGFALADTGALVIDAGTVVLGANETFGTLSGAAGTLSLGANTATFGGATDGSYAGVISGMGGVAKAGASVFTLTGSGTYTGATTVNAGTYRLGSATAFSGAGAVALGASGATFDANGFDFATSGLSGVSGSTLALGSAVATLNNTGATNFAGAVTGTGSLVQAGSGTTTLSGASTYSGATTVNAGTLAVTGSVASKNLTVNGGTLSLAGTSSLTGGSGTVITVNGGATLNTGAGLTLGSGQSLVAGAVAGSTITGALTTSSGSHLSIGNVIGTTLDTLNIGGALTLGGGTVDFYLSNGLGAGDTVNVGSLNITSATTIAATAASGFSVGNSYTLFTGGTIDLNSLTLLSFTPTAGIAADFSVVNVSPGVDSLVVTINPTSDAAITWTGSGNPNDVWDATTNNWSSAGVAVHFVSGNNVTFDATGQHQGDIGVVGTVQPGSVTVSGGNYNLTGIGNIATGTIDVTGGMLTLSGMNATSGDTTVSGGSLVLANTNALQNSTLEITGGSVLFSNTGNGAFTLGGLAGTGSIVLQDNATNAVAISAGNNNADTTFSGTLSGTGALNKIGTGTLTLDGANTYTGGTTVTGGTLALAGGSALADAGAVTVGAAGTLRLDASETIGSLAGSGAVNLQANAITVAGAGTGTFSGVISGAGGSLVKMGIGSLTLTGTNTYDGGTTLEAGTLTLGSSGALGTGGVAVNGGVLAFNSAGAITVANNISGSSVINQSAGVTTLTGDNSTFTGSIYVTGGTLAVASSGALGSSSATVGVDTAGTLAFTNAGAITVTNVISGTGAIALTGGGVTTLTGDNAGYSGTITVASGMLETGTNGSLGTGSVALTGGGLAFSGVNTLTVSGVISGAGSVTQNAVGGVTILSGANTFTGGVNLNGGKLALGSSGALGSTGTIAFNGGTLVFSSANTTDYSARFSTAAGQLYNLDTNGSNVTLATALVSSGGVLTKSGNGMLTLTGANTYDGGTNVDAGRLVISGTTIPSGTFATASGAALEFSSTASRAVNATFTGSGEVTFSGSGGTTDVSGATINTTGNVVVAADHTLELGTSQSTVYTTANLYVAQNATLKGQGTVYGNIVNAGNFAPGNSPGVVIINGDFTNGPNATLNMEINGTTAGLFDQIQYTGTAHLGGTLNISLGFTPTGHEAIPILLDTDASSVATTGAFSSIILPNGLLGAVTVSSTGIVLHVVDSLASVPGLNLPDGLQEFQGAAAGRANNDLLMSTVLAKAFSGNLAGATTDLVNASPIALGSLTAMVVDEGRNSAEFMRNRLDAIRLNESSGYSRGEEWLGFAQASASDANATGDGGATFDHRIYGGKIGFERTAPGGGALGVSVGYDRGQATAHDGGGKFDQDHGSVSTYMSIVSSEGFFIYGGLFAGYSSYDTDRRTVLGSTKGDTTGWDVGGAIQGGYTFTNLFDDYRITPYVGLVYTHAEVEGFTESGTSLAYKVDSFRQESARGRVGADFDIPVFTTEELSVRLGLGVVYEHEFADSRVKLPASFADGSSGTFSTYSYTLPEDSIAVGPFVSVGLGMNKTIRVGYRYENGFGDGDSQRIDASFTARF